MVVCVRLGEASLCLPSAPNPSSPRTEGTYRPRRPERTSSRRSHPRPNGALHQQQQRRRRRHVRGGWSGWKAAGRGGLRGSEAYSR